MHVPFQITTMTQTNNTHNVANEQVSKCNLLSKDDQNHAVSAVCSGPMQTKEAIFG
jgi:hypothetical protein